MVIPTTSTAPRSNAIPSLCDDLPPPRNPSDMVLNIVNTLILHPGDTCHIVLCLKFVFHIRCGVLNRMDDIASYRRRSKGWDKDGPAYIHPRILFGSGLDLKKEFVKQHNITHVINCAFNEDSPMWFRYTFPERYACLEAVDDTKSNILQWYPVFEKTLQRFLAERDSENIFIHCQCGINRSGFLAVLFACKKLKFEYNEVVKCILTQRPCALTNPTYRQQVQMECMK